MPIIGLAKKTPQIKTTGKTELSVKSRIYKIPGD